MMDEFSFWEMIPKKQFHSCIITGYNLDLYYFDYVIRPQLVNLGITNILLLVDAKLLNEAIGTNGGAGLAVKRSYSIVGIKSRGVFHPKILLFFGEASGFLVIGSGNPSSGGFGTNLEVWGAYHVDGIHSAAFPLFQRVVHFLLSYKPWLKGFLLKKLEWCIERAPWYSNSESIKPSSFIGLADGVWCNFISSNDGAIIQSIKNLIGHEEILNISIIAPFFDRELAVLSDLCTIFPKAALNIYLQPENAVFPQELSKPLASKISFFCFDTDKEQDKRRYLHAKLLLFTSKKSEFCLLGSANPTRAAFGTLRQNSVNDEACLLLKRSTGSWIDDLHLNHFFKSQLYKKIKDRFIRPDEYLVPRFKHSIYLFHAELDGHFLSVYGDNYDALDQANIVLFDCWGHEIVAYPFDKMFLQSNLSLRIKIENNFLEKTIVYVQILNKDKTEPKSNKVLVPKCSELVKSDPNPGMRNLVMILSQVESGDRRVFDIFKYIDIDQLIEANVNHIPEPRIHSSIDSNKDKDSLETEQLSKMDYEDFVQPKSASQPHFNYDFLSKHSSLAHILEILKRFIAGIQIYEIEDELNEELENIDESSGKSDSENKKRLCLEPIEITEIEAEVRLLLSFFRNCIKAYDSKFSRKQTIGQLDFTFMAIVTELLLYLVGYRINGRKDNISTAKNVLLPIYGVCGKSKSFTDIFVQVIGKFLLCLTNCKASLEANIHEYVMINQKLFWNILYASSLCIFYYKTEISFKKKYEKLEDWIWIIMYSAFKHLCAQEITRDLIQFEFEQRLKLSGLGDNIPIAQLVEISYACFEKFKKSNQTSLIENITTEKRAYSSYLNIFCVIEKERLRTGGIGVYVCHPGYYYDHQKSNYLRKEPLVIPYSKFFSLE